MECSALSGENIEEIFNKVTQTIVYKIESGEIPQELVTNSRSMGSAVNTKVTSVLEQALKNANGIGARSNCSC
jgi:hypothetical protein